MACSTFAGRINPAPALLSFPLDTVPDGMFMTRASIADDRRQPTPVCDLPCSITALGPSPASKRCRTWYGRRLSRPIQAMAERAAPRSPGALFARSALSPAIGIGEHSRPLSGQHGNETCACGHAARWSTPIHFERVSQPRRQRAAIPRGTRCPCRRALSMNFPGHTRQRPDASRRSSRKGTLGSPLSHDRFSIAS